MNCRICKNQVKNTDTDGINSTIVCGKCVMKKCLERWTPDFNKPNLYQLRQEQKRRNKLKVRKKVSANEKAQRKIL